MPRNNKFIERSLAGALSFLKGSIFADECASGAGFLQSLDPRIKAVSFLILIMTAIFTKNIAVVLILYVLCLVLAYFSNVHIGYFLKRTWIFIPLFSLFIAVPAIFSIFTPGDPAFIINLSGVKLIVTKQGLFGAMLFVSRVVTSVSFMVLLSITTRHFALLRALRVFGIPQVFVMTIGMCYRYIYFFLEVIENTYLAIKSRVGSRLHYKRGQRIVAWNMSSLWHRSYHLNQDVYDAMLSRGYMGDVHTINDFRTSARDWIWLVASTVMCAVLLSSSHWVGLI